MSVGSTLSKTHFHTWYRTESGGKPLSPSGSARIIGAKVSLPIVGTELAADNFGVVEPEIVGVLPLRSFAALRAQVGYRLAYGVEDLPQVDAKYLRGATVTVSLSLGPF